MKEKVLLASNKGHLDKFHMSEVNSLLEQGWSVKSVTLDTHKGWATAIFVLQKEREG